MFHRKQVKHYHEPGQFHGFTFSCYDRLPLLTEEHRLIELARCLDVANREYQMDLVAFVFMPEHLHLLVYPRDIKPEFGLYLARIKQPFSKQMKLKLIENCSPLLARLTVLERPEKECFRFWQEGPGFDRNLETPQEITDNIDYINMNPVKRGLCQSPTDWKWSSACYYLDSPPKQQHPDIPHIHGLPPGTLDQ